MPASLLMNSTRTSYRLALLRLISYESVLLAHQDTFCIRSLLIDLLYGVICNQYT